MWVVLVMLVVSADAASDLPPQGLTFEQALQEASSRSPVLRARRALVEQAQGRLITARTYSHDPEFFLEGARRDGAGESSTDRGMSVAQVIEIGGQRRQRVAQASAELDAGRARLLGEERLLAAQVGAAFVEAIRLRELVEVEEANTELARSLFDIARKRFEAGSVPEMDVNLAQVQVGRAEGDLRLARGGYDVARAVLAEIVGLDPAQSLEPVGELDLPPRSPASLSELVDGALQRRPELQAFRATIDATRARIELARREVRPDLAVEAFRREEGTDRLVGGAVGIRIPLFNRNRGPVTEARAAERQALADHEATVLQVRREVVVARARYDASSEAASNLRQQVLGRLQENLRLLQLSFESGKTGWTEVLVFRRELVDIQRDYINTLTEARLAGIELDLAAGVSVP